MKDYSKRLEGYRPATKTTRKSNKLKWLLVAGFFAALISFSVYMGSDNTQTYNDAVMRITTQK